jgi:hypothetical protein
MENLSMDKFNPTRAELTQMAEKYKTLTIAGAEDREGYMKVDVARKELKKTRIQIEKDGKLLRAEAVAFQKAVIEKEKELVGLIEPVEVNLAEQQEAIDEEREKLKRMELLPERKEKLAAIGIEVDDEFILLMDDLRFSEFYNLENSKYLEEKKRKIEEEQKAAVEKARLEKEEAEENIRREKENAERIAKEAEEKAAAEKAKKEELEKRKEYQAFLEKNSYVEGEDFYLQKTDKKIVLYKKIDQFII